jgi:DUF1680 family protein
MPNGKPVSLSQATDYPWDGDIKITIGELPGTETSVFVRIPGWVENPALKINDIDFSEPVMPGTYLELKRTWTKGDVITLNLPMPVRIMKANPQVEDCRGKLAVMRGPVVYCAEFPVDQNGKEIWENGVFLTENTPFEIEKREDELGGVLILKGKGMTLSEKEEYLKGNTIVAEEDTAWTGILYKKVVPAEIPIPEKASVDLKLVPYYSWANRGPAYMMVWIPGAIALK